MTTVKFVRWYMGSVKSHNNALEDNSSGRISGAASVRVRRFGRRMKVSCEIARECMTKMAQARLRGRPKTQDKRQGCSKGKIVCVDMRQRARGDERLFLDR